VSKLLECGELFNVRFRKKGKRKNGKIKTARKNGNGKFGNL